MGKNGWNRKEDDDVETGDDTGDEVLIGVEGGEEISNSSSGWTEVLISCSESSCLISWSEQMSSLTSILIIMNKKIYLSI